MNRLLRNVSPLLAAIAVIALVAAALVLFWPGNKVNSITADFPRTVSLYEGSDVKILGVPVGKVDSVEPAGTKVRVKFHYDADHKVPATAKAVVISPSIVGDRFIQLTWDRKDYGGPSMRSGTHLGVDRTATPLELDQIFGSINELSKALGPQGANAPDSSGTGALTRLLDSTARNFGGQGVQFNQTLKNLSQLTRTLADNKDELFGTVSQVEQFTQALAKNDDTVRGFNDALANGANLLAEERQDLAAVLDNLSVAMQNVRGFVGENKAILSANIKELNQLSKVLVKHRASLDEGLQDAPVALNNLLLAYDGKASTLDTRSNIGESAAQLTSNPSVVLCAIVPNACTPIKSILKVLGLSRPAALGGAAPVREIEPVDRSLGGLLEVAP